MVGSRYAAVGLMVWAVGMIACASDRDEQETVTGRSPHTHRDSAGIRLSITEGEAARGSLGWTVDTVPDLVLGDRSASGSGFYLVRGVRGTRDGGLLVLDAGNQELRFFDANGRLLKRVGGEGEGPGEFRDPVLVPVWGVDSLLVYDRRLARLQVFSEGGDEARTIRSVRGLSPVGAIGLEHLFAAEVSFLGGESILQQDGLRRLRREYSHWDLRRGEGVSLETFQIDWSYQSSSGWEVPPPFRPRPSAAVSDGGFVVTDGRKPEIREYGIDGEIRRVFRVEQRARPVTQEMLDRVHLEIGASIGSTPDRGSVLDELSIPDSLPVFQSLMTDDLGWIWAGVFRWDPSHPQEWVVFDSAGLARGTVQTPSELDVRSIGRDFIAGVVTDALGVEIVRRHGLRRDGR